MGFIALALTLIWVPYTAHLAKSGDNFTREIGYGFVFNPPQQGGCELAFSDEVSEEELNVACTVKVQISRVLMTSSAIGIATVALSVLLGIFGTSSKNVVQEPLSGRFAPTSLANKTEGKIAPKFPVSGENATDEGPMSDQHTSEFRQRVKDLAARLARLNTSDTGGLNREVQFP
jgi:hypothetical protein